MADAMSPEEFLASLPDDPNAAPVEGQSPSNQPTDVQPAPDLMGAIQAGIKGAQSAGGPSLGEAIGAAAGGPGLTTTGQAKTREQQALDNSGMGAGFATGAMKSVFETKDFLFGDTPPSEQSDFRKSIEQADADMKEFSPIFGGVSSGLGQFAGAMIGIGKISQGVQMIPKVGGAIKGITGAIGGVRGGAAAMSSAKAAVAGAIAFDPHEARLSNLIQGTPLANPINAWLSAKAEDSEAEGRLKSAFESIGLDATLGATFLIGGKILKALQKGDHVEAGRLADEFEANQAKQLEDEANAQADEELANSQSTTELQPGGAGEDAGVSLPRADVGEASGPAPSGPTGTDPGVSPQGEGPVVQGLQGQPKAQGGSSPVMAANDNAGKPAAITPEGGPNGISVKVNQLNETDPLNNGFGIPKRATPMQNPKPYIKFGDENTKAVFDKAIQDVEAVDGHGGFWEAQDAGYKFGQGDGVPYHKFTTEVEIDNFIARTVDSVEESLNDLKGGYVMSDARVDKAVKAMVKLAGVDPGFVLGKIQQAGRMAPQLVAQMETGFVLAQKTFADVYALNERYMLGDWTGYSGKEAMWEDIQHRLSVAATMYGAARSTMANSARAMRRMRRDFMFDPSRYKDVDPAKLSQLLHNTRANPQAIKRIMDQRSILAMGLDTLQFLRVSGLVSGPVTQLVNIATSSYTMLARPLERILGSIPHVLVGNKAALGQLGRDLRQYHALGGSFVSSFKDAAEAFRLNDSVLNPHQTELYGDALSPGAQPIGTGFFRSIEDPETRAANVAFNLFSVAGGAGSVVPRLLGSADELIKQTTYRSYVLSRAAQEATTQGMALGLKGADLKAFIKSEVDMASDAAFTAEGAGTHSAALKEAQTATFQQDLGDIGKKFQGYVHSNRITQFIFPFTKTPTNVIKYGARLTPGLNLLMKEYRQSLSGKMGVEAQMQATGQMMLGTAYMGAAAYLVGQGRFTGGGPSDPKARQQLIESGWRPYSIVRFNDDGTKTYFQLNRFDPVVIPMGIVADTMDHMVHSEWDGDDDSLSSIAGDAITGLGVALSKQFVNKSYLLGASQFMDAVMDPDKKAGSWMGGAAQSMVPFSALTRFADDDEYLRDAQSLADKLRMVTPGLGDGIPYKRNWLGNKIGAPKKGVEYGLGLVTDGSISPVELEANRIALATGYSFGKMAPVQNGVDLRDLVMEDGTNAYERAQELSGKPTPRSKSLEATLEKLITSPGYQKLPDGNANMEGSKSNAISQVLRQYRNAAVKLLQKDKGIREAFMKPEQLAADKFRELRGMPLKVTPNQNGVEHIMDAFGIGNDDPQQP